MKRNIWQTLFFMILLHFGAIAYAQQHIYVSTAGNDFSEGTIQAPLQSVAGAIRHARKLAGTDTIYVHIASGTYFLDGPITLTGEQDARPMVFEGYGDNIPIISGGYPISGWELTPEGWWKTRVPEVVKYGRRFEQLYVNGERAILARTPDKGHFDALGKIQQTLIDTDEGKDEGDGYHIIRYKTLPENLRHLKDINAAWYGDATMNNRDIRILIYQHWENTYRYVDYINPDSGFVYFHGRKSHNFMNRANIFRLENYKEALTAPGEWFLDKNAELTYIPREGERMETAQVYAPAFQQVLIISGKERKPIKGKVFRNLSFQHTSFTLPVQGSFPLQAAHHLDEAIRIDDAEDICFENCEVKHTGNYAMTLNNTLRGKISHCFFYDLGGGGIRVDNSDYVTIYNNILRKGGEVYPSGVGILLRHAANNKVLHNEICDLRYTAVSVGWIWGYAYSRSVNNEVAYNNIHHIGWAEMDDIGGVYTLGVSPGTTIHDNVIHDILSHEYGGWGIFFDCGTSHIVVENNLLYACKSGGFCTNRGRDNFVRNNILAWGAENQIHWGDNEMQHSYTFAHNIVLADNGQMLNPDEERWTVGKAIFKDNCFWDTKHSRPLFWRNAYLEDFKKLRGEKSVLYANPFFKDAIHGDFTFKSLKTARKIGFKPFDYSKAGIIDNGNNWKQKAQMSADEIADFNQRARTAPEGCSDYYKE